MVKPSFYVWGRVWSRRPGLLGDWCRVESPKLIVEKRNSKYEIRKPWRTRAVEKHHPHPPVFVHLLIPQGFKSNVLELRIPKDLETRILDLRILKDLAAAAERARAVLWVKKTGRAAKFMLHITSEVKTSQEK